jgi:uncharacterized protein YcfJ
MKAILIVITSLFAVTLIGCTQQEHDMGTGAIIGAGVGALIGSHSGDADEGAVIGAALGAMAGSAYSDMRQEQAPDGSVNKYVECPECSVTLALPSEAEAGDSVICEECKTEFVLQ